MKADHRPHIRVISIYPCHRGFGFAVLEGIRLVDWGIAKLYSKDDEEFLARMEGMIDRYRPSHLALEDNKNSRRGRRAQKRVNTAAAFATLRSIPTVLVARAELRSVVGLSERATNYALALRIAELFPELATHLPRKRRLWESEAERTNVFQAVGLSVVLRSTAKN